MPGSVNSQTFAATAAGDYTLSVIDAVNGCSTSTVITVIRISTNPKNLSKTSTNFAIGIKQDDEYIIIMLIRYAISVSMDG